MQFRKVKHGITGPEIPQNLLVVHIFGL